MHNVKLSRLAASAGWLPVGRALGKLCNEWADRNDLSVYLGKDGGQGRAPAFFDPATAQIEINSDIAFGQVPFAQVGDLTDPAQLILYPVAGGLSLHESMHARYTTADWKEISERMDAAEWDCFKNMEETRIEYYGTVHFPEDRGYLRAAVKSILLGDDEWSPRLAFILLLGRHRVGVMDEEDVEKVLDFLLRQDDWTESVIEDGLDIVAEFAMLEDWGVGLEAQIELAKQLNQLLPVDPPSAAEELLEAIGKALSAAEIGGGMEVIEAFDLEVSAQAEAEAAAAAKRGDQNRNVANGTFRDIQGKDVPRPSELRSSREPTDEEWSAAIQLASALEKARYRERMYEDVLAETPPGRLHRGEAKRRDAAIAVGASPVGFTPFRARRYEDIDEPPLTVGIMTDVSGSMMTTMPAVGTVIWVLAEAVYRVGEATAAQVYFGQNVSVGLQKGEHAEQVRIWHGKDSSHRFNRAFQALDGELDLLNGHGARLLVVFSDGEYETAEETARDMWLRECTANGVAVLWLDRYDGDEGRSAVEQAGVGAEYLVVGTQPLKAVEVIGLAAQRALADVSGL